jgi:DMSO reductase anchor subunit
MLVALVASLLHLGTPFNAWRAVANLRSSWLSREILFALLLSATATLFALSPWLKLDTYLTQQTLIWAAELFGLALVYSMAHAYRLPAVPVWNTWRTLASFMTTASVLGSWSVAAWLAIAAPTLAVISWLAGAGSILLFVQFLLTREWAKRSGSKHEQVRVVIAGMAIAAAFLTVWGSSMWALVALVLAFTSEVLDRNMFYQARNTFYG